MPGTHPLQRAVALAYTLTRSHTWDELLRCGMPPSTAHDWERTGFLERIAPSVYRVGGAPDTWHRRVMRAVLDSGGWASHRTRAALHNLDGHNGSVIEVVVQRWRRSSKHDGYTVHETKDLRGVDLTSRRGIPCTSLVRTLLDLPAVEHPFRAEQALDDACRKNADLLPVVRERFLQVARRGRNGTTVMRGFLNERPGGHITVGSSFESLTLKGIKAAGIETPVKQFKVEDGDFVAYLDISGRNGCYAMECDSLKHHFSKAAQAWDRRRRRHLKRLGWEVSEWTYDEVKSGVFVPELRQLLVLAYVLRYPGLVDARTSDIRRRRRGLRPGRGGRGATRRCRSPAARRSPRGRSRRSARRRGGRRSIRRAPRRSPGR